MTTIHVKLNRYLYFHQILDHQTGHQALFFMTSFGRYGNNYQFFMTMVSMLVNQLIFFIYGGGERLGTGGNFHRGQYSGG